MHHTTAAHTKTLLYNCFTVLFFFCFPLFADAQLIKVATTTVTVNRCGDAEVTPPVEECDDGVANNTGGYSTTIVGKKCESNCQLAPFCGDGILQTIYNEECDDSNNTSGDFCSDICKAEPSSPAGNTTGGGSGSGGGGSFAGGSFVPSPGTQVTIKGKAYPNSNVNILKDGKVIGVVAADAKADFLFTTANVVPGVATFGFWAEDKNGLRSIAFTTTFQVTQGAVTTISGVYLPPTISLDKKVAKQGEIINMKGQSVPEVKVVTHVNSNHEIITEIPADKEGNWKLAFDTSQLEEDAHTAKAMFRLKQGAANVESGFSQSVTFFVGDRKPGEVGTADLNTDTKVNLVDFSILLFHWGTNGGSSSADINLDGKVNLADFSIMLFHWTG